MSIHEVFSTVYKGNHTKSTSLIDRSMRLVGKLGLCRALGRWKQVKIACTKTVSLTTTTAVRRSHTLWLACMGWRTGREYGNLHWNNRSNLSPVIFTERQSHNWKTIFSRTWKRKQRPEEKRSSIIENLINWFSYFEELYQQTSTLVSCLTSKHVKSWSASLPLTKIVNNCVLNRLSATMSLQLIQISKLWWASKFNPLSVLRFNEASTVKNLLVLPESKFPFTTRSCTVQRCRWPMSGSSTVTLPTTVSGSFSYTEVALKVISDGASFTSRIKIQVKNISTEGNYSTMTTIQCNDGEILSWSLVGVKC